MKYDYDTITQKIDVDDNGNFCYTKNEDWMFVKYHIIYEEEFEGVIDVCRMHIDEYERTDWKHAVKVLKEFGCKIKQVVKIN